MEEKKPNEVLFPPVTNLVEHFRQEFESACTRLDLETSEVTEAYIVHLLDGFMRHAPEHQNEVGFERPAALMLSDAVHSAGEQRIEAYRRLGDACLYNCGFFDKRLTRRGVKASYYQTVGQSAYQDLFALMRYKQPGGVFSQIFGELSTKFGDIVTALRNIAQAAHTSATEHFVAQKKPEAFKTPSGLFLSMPHTWKVS